MRLSCFRALTFFPLLCVSRVAAEAPRPEVALVVAGPDQLAKELARQLSTQPALPVRLGLAELPNSPRAPDDGSDSETLAALARAQKAYVAAEFASCLSELGEPSRVSDALATGHRYSAARLLLWRIACDVGRGAEADARLSARRFATMELPLPDDVSRVAQDAEAVLSEALHQAGVRERAQLDVVSEPAGVAVEVDGRAADCETPCTLPLYPGAHLLRLHGDGVTAALDQVELAPLGTQHRLRLEPAPPELSRRQWSARYRQPRDVESAGSLRLLARALPALRLVVLTLEPKGEARYALRGSYTVAGELRAREGSEPRAPAQLLSAARGVVSTLLVRGNTLPAPRPLWKSGWFWVALSAVALGAALGTGFALRPSTERTEVRFQ